MPTYEYQCSSCGHRYEKFQSIKAAPIKRCPACGKNTAQRLIGTGAGLIFKGSGFYITDYRSEGYKEKAKAESGSGGESKPADGAAAKDSKPAASNDSAPAAKAEAKPAAAKTETKKSGEKKK